MRIALDHHLRAQMADGVGVERAERFAIGLAHAVAAVGSGLHVVVDAARAAMFLHLSNSRMRLREAQKHQAVYSE